MRELSFFENGQEKAVGITVKNENGIQYVSARELHTKLEITDRFSRWFESLLKYGFEENIDFWSVKTSTHQNQLF